MKSTFLIHPQNRALLLLLSSTLMSCSSVPFAATPAPAFAPASIATPPTLPEARPVEEARRPLEWRVVNLSGKFSLRKKSTAVRVTMARADGSEANSTMLTLALLGRLMEVGYGPVQDLSTADRIQVEVERGLGTTKVKYSGTLADVTPIASPLHADYVLTVTLLVAPGPSKSHIARFAIDTDAMAAYRSAYDQFAARGQQALQQLDTAYRTYETAFEGAKADYERRGGGYSTFPTKAPGQIAVEGRAKVAEDYASLRKVLVDALASAIAPADYEKTIANKSETRSLVEQRVLATATLSEQGSNRILWLALADQNVSDEEASAATLIDQLSTAIPFDKKGSP